mgnify:CR=1 FL=1
MEEKKTYPCLGHEGKCEFCKEEYGKPRYVGDSIEMKRLHEVDPVSHKLYTVIEPIVDYCCHFCRSNAEARKKEYVESSIS